MKKQSRKTATVTGIGSRSRRRNEQTSVSGAHVVLAFNRNHEEVAVSQDLKTSPRDRAAEYLAEIGLVDREIAAIRESVSVLPIDTELVGRCRAFVAANLSGWDHTSWIAFVNELAEDGYAIGPDSGRWWLAQKQVGVLLESIRAAELTALPAKGEKAIAQAA